jgi:hypothetical protein
MPQSYKNRERRISGTYIYFLKFDPKYSTESYSGGFSDVCNFCNVSKKSSQKNPGWAECSADLTFVLAYVNTVSQRVLSDL